MYAFGIQPSTMRDVLSLIRHYGWKQIIYLYDYEYGPEKLQQIYRFGYRVWKCEVVGFSKIETSEDAINYLRKLDTSGKYENFRVILDMDVNLARDIIIRHVHDIHVRKKNFHFMLSQPTLETFWASAQSEFGAVNITGFLGINTEKYNAKRFKEEWMQLSPKAWLGAGSALNISSYYYRDIALTVFKAIENMYKKEPNLYRGVYKTNEKMNCLDISQRRPVFNGAKLATYIKDVDVNTGVTGRIQFDDQGSKVLAFRKGFNFTVIETTSNGYREIGTSTTGQFIFSGAPMADIPQKLPLTTDGNILRVTTKISPPYMMLKSGINASNVLGNDRFEGYCKDLMELLAKELQVKYELRLVEDDTYGEYVESDGKWNGIVGDLIQGKADLAVADLLITGKRQKVIDYTDPFDMISFSLLMKNPHAIMSSSSIFFIFNAFSLNVWICVFVAAILFSFLFHGVTKFTGAPDSIESASGIWGRKLTVVLNVWFALGSSTLQGTGVYPRSISSRILTGIWWFFTLVLSCLFIASMTAQLQMDNTVELNSPQLAQLKSLSLESIMRESLERGWPKIGIVYPSYSAYFLKKSSFPVFRKYASFLDDNPDVKVSTPEEGIKRVRKSNGDFVFFTASLSSEYAARRQPCDLISTPNAAYYYTGYGIATKSRSPWRAKVNTALHTIKVRGELGHLHRKWWIDSNECKTSTVRSTIHGNLISFSGLFCILTAGLLILLVVFAIQYSRKTHHKESRRQQLSFEDMNLGQALPLPHPELLAEPPVVLHLPEYEKRTLL
ncbi:glutamate receptor 1-like [Uloborus diversus]|uniref:glutamate receptor 1-like n=1 Tax=Uloborus diversus TaxID=327109 RepID=UPI00240A4B7A|nr:glutamate receptor 1-like [Uloborus diversus]